MILTYIPYILFAIAAALFVYGAFNLVTSMQSGGALSSFRKNRQNAAPSRSQQVGASVLPYLPISLETWQDHLLWAKRGGYEGTLEGVAFKGLLYAGASLLLLIIFPAPVLLIVPVMAFVYPFIGLRSKANRVRRSVVRAMPEVAALVSAEVSAGNSPEQALGRAAELPGAMGGLLGEVNAYAGKTGRPVFSRQAVRGALVDVLDETKLTELRAFGRQMDEVSSKGVDAPDLMNDVARALAREYRERVMTEKEKLGSKLTGIVAMHFFFPAVLLILAAFLLPLINLFG